MPRRAGLNGRIAVPARAARQKNSANSQERAGWAIGGARLGCLVLVFSVGHASMAVAGESLLASATRLVRATEAAAASARLAGRPPQPSFALAQAGQAAVSATGMRKRTKLMIFFGAAAAFAGTAYAIDHRVKDVTPSSLGTRQD
jgi:hypothetical protein